MTTAKTRPPMLRKKAHTHGMSCEMGEVMRGVVVRTNGRKDFRTLDVFCAITQDLEGALPDHVKVEYVTVTRARAERVWKDDAGVVNYIWRKNLS